MTDYTALDIANLEPGDPGTDEIFQAFYLNLIAALEGSDTGDGAPGLSLLALKRPLAAGDVRRVYDATVRSVTGGASAGDFNEVNTLTWRFLQPGSVRIKGEYRRTNTSLPAARFEIRKNGALDTFFTTLANTFTPFTADVAVVRGDTLTLVLMAENSQLAEVRNIELATGGEMIHPSLDARIVF